MTTIRINGVVHTVDIEPKTPLLWVLRDHLGHREVKYGCGISLCGACTVLIDNQAVRSCGLQIGDIDGVSITTIKGLEGAIADKLTQAWQEEDVPQCGYCQPAQILTAGDLLMRNLNPTDDDIKSTMSSVLCRCGTYSKINRAIHNAIEKLNHG